MTAFLLIPFVGAMIPNQMEGLMSEVAVDASGRLVIPNTFMEGGMEAAAEAAQHQPTEEEMQRYKDLRRSSVRFQAVIRPKNELKPWQKNMAGTGLFAGSGWVLENDKDGPLIVTNSHVVNDAGELRISIPSESQEQFEAKVVLNSPSFDVALVRLVNKDVVNHMEKTVGGPLVPVEMYEGMPELGAETFALGYPLGQMTPKLTKGVISGVEKVGDFLAIQTTTPISPGNSGGPLYLAGTKKVVGINYAAMTGENSQSNNFAIHLEKVRMVQKQYHATKDTPAASFAETDRPQYVAYECEKDRTQCEYIVPPVTAQASPATPELLAQYGCSGGIFINSIPDTSMLKIANPPIADQSFITHVNGQELDEAGEAPSPIAFGGNVGLTDLFYGAEDAHVTMTGKVTTCTCGKTVEHEVPLKFNKGNMHQDMIPTIDEADLMKSDFENFGSVTVQQMTINNAKELVQMGRMDLMRFLVDKPSTPLLIVTDVDVENDAVSGVHPGDIVQTVNGANVTSLSDFRNNFHPTAQKDSCQKEGKNMWTMETTTGGEVVEDFDDALKRQLHLARTDGYAISKAVRAAAKEDLGGIPMEQSFISKSIIDGLEPQPVEMRTDVSRGGAAWWKVKSTVNGIRL